MWRSRIPLACTARVLSKSSCKSAPSDGHPSSCWRREIAGRARTGLERTWSWSKLARSASAWDPCAGVASQLPEAAPVSAAKERRPDRQAGKESDSLFSVAHLYFSIGRDCNPSTAIKKELVTRESATERVEVYLRRSEGWEIEEIPRLPREN